MSTWLSLRLEFLSDYLFGFSSLSYDKFIIVIIQSRTEWIEGFIFPAIKLMLVCDDNLPDDVTMSGPVHRFQSRVLDRRVIHQLICYLDVMRGDSSHRLTANTKPLAEQHSINSLLLVITPYSLTPTLSSGRHLIRQLPGFITPEIILSLPSTGANVIGDWLCLLIWMADMCNLMQAMAEM